MKVGVFTCWCGENIARTVDCDCKTMKGLPKKSLKCPAYTAPSRTNTCAANPVNNSFTKKIAELGLDAIVVAACSPHMHLKTFRKAVETAGINPFLVEVANIREHCSWVHTIAY